MDREINPIGAQAEALPLAIRLAAGGVERRD